MPRSPAGPKSRAFSLRYTAPRPIDSLRRVSANGTQILLRFTNQTQVSYLRKAPDPLCQARPALPAAKAAMPAGRQVSQLILLVREVEVQPIGQLLSPLAVFTDE